MSILPKISIITPSYNQGHYLEETINSILEQGYPNLELIIIDGGSTDNTVNVIKKFEYAITHWVSEPDRGQAHAINKGIALATGDVFNWINSDDYLEPGALHAIGEFFLNNPDKNVCCGYTHCFYDEDKTTSHTYRMGLRATTTDTILNYAMNQPGTFYRMHAINSLNGVNESLRYVFDNELWFRYLCRFGIDTVGITEKLLVNFRLHKSSKSVGEGFEKFWYEQNDIWINLAMQLNFSTALLGCIKQLPHQNKYTSQNWDMSFLDTDKVRNYWYLKYLNTLYLKGYKTECKKAFKNLLLARQLHFNRINLSLFTKLFLSPL
ncbi:glycosyltransferase family 2 protein [Pontibacter sp. CAU 1760]